MWRMLLLVVVPSCLMMVLFLHLRGLLPRHHLRRRGVLPMLMIGGRMRRVPHVLLLLLRRRLRLCLLWLRCRLLYSLRRECQ